MVIKKLLCMAITTISFFIHAETYPSGPVKVIVPFAAGTSTDVISRKVAQVLSEGLHQSFVIMNRPGANGTIGAAEVARAKPDGYTLLIGSNTSIAAAPFLFKQIPYKPLEDFLPVARIGAVPFVLVVNENSQIKTIQDLIDYAHKNPGKLNWGYANAANQVAATALTYTAKMDTVAVPYTGVPQLVSHMLGGYLDFSIIDMTNAAPQIASGKLRALAVTSGESLSQLPDVPPLNKIVQGYELLGWYGVYVPADTPKSIIDTLANILLSSMDTDAYKTYLTKSSLVSYPSGPEELAKFGQIETEKWAKMVKAAGIQPE